MIPPIFTDSFLFTVKNIWCVGHPGGSLGRACYHFGLILTAAAWACGPLFRVIPSLSTKLSCLFLTVTIIKAKSQKK